MIAVVVIVEVGKELEQPEQDHAREAQRHIVNDEVLDMVSNTAAYKGKAVAALVLGEDAHNTR